MKDYLHGYNIRIIFLFLLGLVLSFFMQESFNRGLILLLSDSFFCISMTFLIYGIWEFVLKSGFFNGLIFGTKSLKELIYSRIDNSSNIKEDYINFIRTRKKERNVLTPILISGIFLTISILVSAIN